MPINYFEGLENFHKKRILKPQDIQRLKSAAEVGLAILAVTGAVAVTALAPNLAKAILTFRKVRKSWNHNPSSYYSSSQQTKNLFYYLKKHGYISLKKKDGVWNVALTKLGLKKVNSLKFNSLRVEPDKKWVGRWWLVAADVPTKEYRWGADMLRVKIREMGLYPLQRTLWLYPFNPSAEIEFLTQMFGISHFVTVMEINRLDKDDEKKLRQHFKKAGVL